MTFLVRLLLLCLKIGMSHQLRLVAVLCLAQSAPNHTEALAAAVEASWAARTWAMQGDFVPNGPVARAVEAVTEPAAFAAWKAALLLPEVHVTAASQGAEMGRGALAAFAQWILQDGTPAV